jgi:hypothetical protein
MISESLIYMRMDFKLFMSPKPFLMFFIARSQDESHSSIDGFICFTTEGIKKSTKDTRYDN